MISGHLLVIKALPVHRSKVSLFAKSPPTQEPLGFVKSITELQRLFKIDVLAAESGARANEIELVLHFVNRERDPKLPSVIKQFYLVNDAATKEFLRSFEYFVTISSPFYKK